MADLCLLRWPRAAMFAAVCVALAAAGHGLMSGRPAPPWALVVGLIVVLSVAVPLAGRERSFGVIMVSVLLAQLGLHTLFEVAAPTAGSLTPLWQISAHQGGMPAGHGTADGHLSTASGVSAMPGMGGPAGHAGLGMLFAHLCAALIAAWWLRRGEAAVFTLGRRARARALHPWRRLVALIAAPPLAGVRPGVRWPGRTRRSVSAAPRHVPPLRGPPAYARSC